jgi:hypothetical protein
MVINNNGELTIGALHISVVCLHMPLQATILNKRLITILAHESPDIIVYLHMFYQGPLPRVPLPTNLALKVLFVAMTDHVSLQQLRRISVIVASLTRVHFPLSMDNSLMLSKIGICQESLRAKATFVIVFLLSMHRHYML